jgi:Ser/Thr protein kinase RdoA (MazF antagonist)
LRRVMLGLGTGPDVYGLIHADLHMDNVLFRDGEARAIDSDDCGFGYWMCDFAVSLCDWHGAEEWPRYRDVLLEG